MRLLLTNGQFRLLWFGGALAVTGHVMYGMVHGWLTLTLTDSPFWVGAVAGTMGIGLLTFSILGGLVADRFQRRLVVAISELVIGLSYLLLAVLVLSGRVEVWHLMATAFVTGAAEAMRLPSMMALNIDLVGRKKLLTATASNFVAFGAAGIIGPLLAGAIVARLDIGWAYVAMTAFHFFSAVIVLRLDVTPAVNNGGVAPLASSPWRSIWEVAVYVFNTPWVRMLLVMQLVGEAFGWAHQPMLPVMARDVLGVGAQGLGYMVSVSHAGFLFSNLVLSSVGDLRYKGRVAVVGYGGFGLMLILFAASRSLPLSLVLLGLAYAVEALYEANQHTMVQTAVPDRMRGRVISLQMMTWGVTGISGFYTGAIARRLGVATAVTIGGGVVLVNAIRQAPALVRADSSQSDLNSGF